MPNFLHKFFHFIFFSCILGLYSPFSYGAAIDLSDSFPPVINQGRLGSCSSCAVAALIERRTGIKPSIAHLHDRVWFSARVPRQPSTLLKSGFLPEGELSLSYEEYVKYARHWTGRQHAALGTRIAHSVIERENQKNRKKKKAIIAKFRPLNMVHMRTKFVDLPEGVCLKELPSRDLECLVAALEMGFPFVASLKNFHVRTETFCSFVSCQFYSLVVDHIPTIKTTGHSVVICGWDPLKRAFKVRNSWGKEWGYGGHTWMPEDCFFKTLMGLPSTLATDEEIAAIKDASERKTIPPQSVKWISQTYLYCLLTASIGPAVLSVSHFLF